MIGTFHNLFDAQRSNNTSSSVKVMQTESSLYMIIFILSRIVTMLLLACTPNDNRFWAIGNLWAIFSLIERLGRRSSLLALVCTLFFDG